MRRRAWRRLEALLFSAILAALTLFPPAAAPDTIPPATVVDLLVAYVNQTSATLRWTAPGDDGTIGTATWYDFRYTTAGPIADANFYSATHYELPFFPHAPGTTEEVTIPGLIQGTTYWFALMSSDEVPNWSGASNSPSAVPSPSTNQPPVASVVFSPATPQPLQAVTFNASASYDPDGTIASYAWTFGDGTNGSGRTVTHAYPDAGQYTVTLTVTDNGGLTAIHSETVTVAVTSGVAWDLAILVAILAGGLGVAFVVAVRRRRGGEETPRPAAAVAPAELRPGRAYLAEAPRPRPSLRLLESVDGGTRPVLAISRADLDRDRTGRDGSNLRCYRLVDRGSPRGEGLLPPSLERAGLLVEEFLAAEPRGMVFLEGIEFLSDNNNFAGVLRLVRLIVDRVVRTDHVFLVSVAPGILSVEDLRRLETEMEVLPPAAS
ncbi:MAG TPA: PKD domain-containing protein [Thermoplasmata archaeon]|nr:PKD domain-containing protein [Thermoplasmata archaeon]